MKKVRDADDIEGWELVFAVTEQDSDGNMISVPLAPYSEDTAVTNENKAEFLSLVVERYLGSVSKQVDAIRSGLSIFVPPDILKRLEPEGFSSFSLFT